MARSASRCPNRHLCSTSEQIAALFDRQERNRTGLFWAEGCRSFFSAIDNGWPIQCVAYCPQLLRSRTTYERLTASTIPRLRLSPVQFATLSRRSEPDGIGIVCPQRWEPLIDQHPKPGDVWVALDSVRTPGNLGTILRTVAAVGARGVMLIGGETDPYESAAIRASMGALFATKLIRTSARALEGWKVRRHVTFVGASPNAPDDYRDSRLKTPLVLMMGSERSGLRERQTALCDHLVRLPMTDRVDSLNLATATSVLLYSVQERVVK